MHLGLDDTAQRTGRAGEGHFYQHLFFVNVDAVNQAQVNDVDADFGIDNALQMLFDYIFLQA